MLTELGGSQVLTELGRSGEELARRRHPAMSKTKCDETVLKHQNLAGIWKVNPNPCPDVFSSMVPLQQDLGSLLPRLLVCWAGNWVD